MKLQVNFTVVITGVDDSLGYERMLGGGLMDQGWTLTGLDQSHDMSFEGSFEDLPTAISSFNAGLRAGIVFLKKCLPDNPDVQISFTGSTMSAIGPLTTNFIDVQA